jgi:hypothetical protein
MKRGLVVSSLLIVVFFSIIFSMNFVVGQSDGSCEFSLNVIDNCASSGEYIWEWKATWNGNLLNRPESCNDVSYVYSCTISSSSSSTSTATSSGGGGTATTSTSTAIAGGASSGSSSTSTSSGSGSTTSTSSSTATASSGGGSGGGGGGGTETLILTENNAVFRGSEDIDGSLVDFVITENEAGDKISEIDIKMTPFNFRNDVEHLNMGKSFIDPVFSTISLKFASMTPNLISTTDRELIEFYPSGNQNVGIRFVNRAGKQYDFDLLKVSGTGVSAGFIAMEVTLKNRLMRGDIFATCSNGYSQVWELKSITTSSSTQELKVQDLGSGSTTQTLTLTGTEPGATANLTLADASTITLRLFNSTSVDVLSPNNCGFNQNGIAGYNHAGLFTKNGALIYLDDVARFGGSNGHVINIIEETSYNGGSFTDNNGNVLGKNNLSIRFLFQQASRSGYQTYLDFVINEQAGVEGEDWWTGVVDNVNSDQHWVTKYGTFITRTGADDETVSIYYPEDAASLGFYIGQNPTTLAGESKAIETSSQPLYMGDDMSVTKSRLSRDDLPNLLADGTLVDTDGIERDYELYIQTPNARNIFGNAPSYASKPSLYTKFNDNNIFYRLIVVFPTAVEPSKLAGAKIRLFGKNYIFSTDANDLGNDRLVLISSTETGNTCSDTDGGKDYFSKGSTSGVHFGNSYEYNDVCIDGEFSNLLERFCDDQNRPHDQYFKCPYGCNDGSCIRETFSIHFDKGWNLVSGYHLIPNVFSEISNGKINEWFINNAMRAVFYFNFLSQNNYIEFLPSFDVDALVDFLNLLSFDINKPDLFNGDFQNVLHSSMWVYSPEDKNVDIEVLNNYPLILENTVLSKGWNFLSITPDMIRKSVNEWRGDCTMSVVALWSSKYQGWDVADSDDLNDIIDESLLWKGLVVKVNKMCTLGDNIKPPPLPEGICTDSDGLSFLVQGTTCVDGLCLTDECVDNSLIEYYCSENGMEQTERYASVEECEEGRLIRESHNGNLVDEIAGLILSDHYYDNDCELVPEDNGDCDLYVGIYLEENAYDGYLAAVEVHNNVVNGEDLVDFLNQLYYYDYLVYGIDNYNGHNVLTISSDESILIYLWTSGNRVIYVGVDDGFEIDFNDLEEVLESYLVKYPSSLPDELPNIPEITCIDSDNGVNFYLRGNIESSTEGINEQDVCVDANNNGPYHDSPYVREWYCRSFNDSATQIYECPYGCVEGACVSEQEIIIENQCILNAPYNCISGDATTSGVVLDFINNGGETHNIVEVSVDNCGVNLFDGVGLSLPDSASATIEMDCNLVSGSLFKGDITINYKKEGSNLTLTTLGKLTDIV